MTTNNSPKQAVLFLVFVSILGFRLAHADPVEPYDTCGGRGYEVQSVLVNGVEDPDYVASFDFIQVSKEGRDDAFSSVDADMDLDGERYTFYGEVERMDQEGAR